MLATEMFIVIIAPIVITVLLAALIAGFVYLWDGGDTEILVHNQCNDYDTPSSRGHSMFIHPNRVVFLAPQDEKY